MRKCSKLFVGMDVHKDSVDVATGDEAGGEVRHYGAVGGDLASITRLCRKLESTGKVLVFVYEAGPCGFLDLSVAAPARARVLGGLARSDAALER